jgi:hypothetical protein
MRPWIALLVGFVMVWGSPSAFANPMKRVRNLMATPGGHVFLHLDDGKLVHARVKNDTLTRPRQISYLPDVIMTTMTHDGYLYYVKRDGTLWLLRYDLERDRFTTPEPKEVGTGWDAFTHIAAGKGGHVYAVRLDGELVVNRHDGRRKRTARWSTLDAELGSGWLVVSLHERRRGELFAYGEDARVYRLENPKKPGLGWADEGGEDLGRHDGYAHVAAAGDDLYFLQPNGALELATVSKGSPGQKRRVDTTSIARHENVDACSHMSRRVAACAIAVQRFYEGPKDAWLDFKAERIKNWLKDYSGGEPLTPSTLARRCEVKLGTPLRPGSCAQQCRGAWNDMTRKRCMKCVHKEEVQYMEVFGNSAVRDATWSRQHYQCADGERVYGSRDGGQCLSK